jgi:hypothetical protein
MLKRREMVGHIFIVLASIFNALGRPFQGNQNQYLYFAAVKSAPSKIDPLYTTSDIYPMFTALSKVLIDTFGQNGLRFAALVGTYIALLSVYRLSRLFCIDTESVVPYIVVFLVSIMFLPSFFWEKEGGTLRLILTEGSIFFGLGGHYLISKPAYFQPNLFGVLLLLSFTYFLQGFLQRENQRKSFIYGSICFSASVIMHPIYLITFLLGLLPYILFELINKKDIARLNSLLKYSFLPVLLSIVLNSNLYFSSFLSIWNRNLKQDESLKRFSFERIGHHTLITEWPKTDTFMVLIIVFGFFLTTKMIDNRLLFYWGLCLTVFSILSAVAVQVFSLATLGMLFPWRITVILFPIACTVILTFFTQRLNFLVRKSMMLPSYIMIGILVTLSIFGDAKLLKFEDGAVEVIRQSEPQGLGLIPIDQENVRLNAQVPVYVDWKSAPYLGHDIQLWWQRIDEINSAMTSPGKFCKFLDETHINWLLLDKSKPMQNCLLSWKLLGEDERWTVLQRKVF